MTVPIDTDKDGDSDGEGEEEGDDDDKDDRKRIDVEFFTESKYFCCVMDRFDLSSNLRHAQVQILDSLFRH
jgi:hypothetical protein